MRRQSEEAKRGGRINHLCKHEKICSAEEEFEDVDEALFYRREISHVLPKVYVSQEHEGDDERQQDDAKLEELAYHQSDGV